MDPSCKEQIQIQLLNILQLKNLYLEQKEAAPGEEPKYTSAQPLTPVYIPIDDITLSDSDIEVDFQSKVNIFIYFKRKTKYLSKLKEYLG